MSDKFTYRLVHDTARRLAAEMCFSAPDGWMVTFQAPKNSLIQSAKFHAMCGDASKQCKYMGRKFPLESWKVLFISGHAIATKIGADVIPGLENEFVNIRESTASMSMKRMSSLIEYTLAWCVSNDVKLTENRHYY